MEDGELSIYPWWKPEDWYPSSPRSISFQESVTSVRDSLDQAVARQLVADVPVSLFLSGGIDSTAIAASATRVSKTPLVAYTACFDGNMNSDDIINAAQITKALGLQHSILDINQTNIHDAVYKMAISHDEPFSDAANIPLYLMSDSYSSVGKVVLQGDGGDEMFAGYRQYTFLAFRRILHFLRFLPSFYTKPGSLISRFSRILDAFRSKNSATRMSLLLTMETLHQPPESLLTCERRFQLSKSCDPFLAYRNAATRFSSYTEIDKMLLTDVILQLASQFLPKVDRASMSAGVEARVPFLDENVIKTAFSIPVNQKTKAFTRKLILRKTLEGVIPKETIYQPKSGFGVPYGRWLRTSLFDMAYSFSLDSHFIDTFGFSRNKIQKAFIELKKGEGQYSSFTLWKIFQLALWSSIYRE